MTKLCSKIYRIMEVTVSVLAVLMTGGLFLSGFFGTAYVTDMASQVVLLRRDNLLTNLIGILLAFGVGGGIYLIVKKNFEKRLKVLLAVVLIWYFAVGFLLALFGRTVPAADAMSVYRMGAQIARGDLSFVHPTDSYLSYYPQQLGMSSFLGLLLFFINLVPTSLEGYHFIKVVYVILVCITIFCLHKTVETVWENPRISCVFLLLAFCNFPLIIYATFVYGEIPGLCFFAMGVMFLARYLKNPDLPLRYPVLSILCMTLSVFVRKNMLIMLIAVAIICFGQWIYTRRKNWGIYLFCLLFCTLSISPAAEKVYETLAGREIRSGVTALSYVAMGMQEASRGSGWYNGFNFLTYQENDLDSELANEVSMQAISERLDYFGEHPGEALDFYGRKFLTQWTDGSYAARQAVYAELGGRAHLVEAIYNGAYSPYFIEFCNLLQNLVYLGSFVWSIVMCKKVKEKSGGNLALYLGLVMVLGGLIFHMLWEANSRYILLFGQILFVYGAAGLFSLGSGIVRRFQRWKEARG